MKNFKIYLFSLLLCIFMVCTSCNNENDIIGQPNIENIQSVSKPSTEVFVQGQLLNNKETKQNTIQPYFTQTRASSTELPWLYESPEGWITARFSIRADGTIPGYIDQSSSLYYGRSAGKSGNNRGKIYSIYPYGHYNDRDYDYYKNNKKTGENIGLFRYVYDENGQKTQLAIIEAPSVVDILGDEVQDLTNEINNNKNVSKNQQILDNVNHLLSYGQEYLDSHILWYVVKEVGLKNGWHVNGVIRDYEIPKPLVGNILDNVEIDIHQQIHQDWNEIKTSIHIRTACESIKLNIPLEYEDIIEQDDFDIRVYDFYYKEYVVSHTITHDNKGITIEISNIPASLIDELKNTIGDGLTIEIHSYCTKEDVWEQLSKSKVLSTGKPCTINGQIHSALHPEIDPIQIYINK